AAQLSAGTLSRPRRPGATPARRQQPGGEQVLRRTWRSAPGKPAEGALAAPAGRAPGLASVSGALRSRPGNHRAGLSVRSLPAGERPAGGAAGPGRAAVAGGRLATR